MTSPTCEAAELRPGVVVAVGGHGGGDPRVLVTILRERDPDRRDVFGRELQSWWARREDTGAEGFLDFGGALVDLPLEVVRPCVVAPCGACDRLGPGACAVSGSFVCVDCRERSIFSEWAPLGVVSCANT